MDHEQLEESLSLYALGTLEPDSAGEVRAHLATGCPRCCGLLRQYQNTVTMLPYALVPHAPPTDLKSRIMAAISGQGAPETAAAPPLQPEIPLRPDQADTIRRLSELRTKRSWWASPVLAAALSGLLLGAGIVYYLYSPNETALTNANVKIAELERQVMERQQQLEKATLELDRAIAALRTTHELLAKNQEQVEILQAAQPGRSAEEIARIFSSPTARMADLHGTDVAKNAYALVFVDPETRRGFFYANNLPPPPKGKTYQLWVITNKPISAGVFSLDRGHKGRVMMQDLPAVAGIKKFAVSLEPAGGRKQPSGMVYLAGGM